MPNFIDLTGQTFSRLRVIERTENSKFGKAMWKCQCSCGNFTTVLGAYLTSERTKSCGCFQKEGLIKRLTKHGMRKTSEYRTWKNIINRCCNPNNPAFKNYGGRGISICDEWKNDFMAFFNHVGKKLSPKHSIDRIDNDGNYEPGNVKWATKKEQANNNRKNHNITLHGWNLTIGQWANFTGIGRSTIWQRLRLGWHPAKAIFKKDMHKG